MEGFIIKYLNNRLNKEINYNIKFVVELIYELSLLFGISKKDVMASLKLHPELNHYCSNNFSNDGNLLILNPLFESNDGKSSIDYFKRVFSKELTIKYDKTKIGFYENDNRLILLHLKSQYLWLGEDVINDLYYEHKMTFEEICQLVNESFSKRLGCDGFRFVPALTQSFVRVNGEFQEIRG